VIRHTPERENRCLKSPGQNPYHAQVQEGAFCRRRDTSQRKEGKKGKPNKMGAESERTKHSILTKAQNICVKNVTKHQAATPFNIGPSPLQSKTRKTT